MERQSFGGQDEAQNSTDPTFEPGESPPKILNSGTSVGIQIQRHIMIT